MLQVQIATGTSRPISVIGQFFAFFTEPRRVRAREYSASVGGHFVRVVLPPDLGNA